MRELILELVAALDDGQRLCYCRLVETRGSTPQKAGATMLVYPGGRQAGTLGGGCVEAEVKRRALATLQEGQAEVVRFQLDSDYGWDDGLICGGRMQVLIDPLGAAAAAYFRALARLLEDGAGSTEAIVFDPTSELPVTASYLFDAEGRLVAHQRGPLEAGDAPAAIRASLEPLTSRPRPRAVGGISYLPNLGRCRLLIVGGGHVGQAVGQLAADLDFEVWVLDDREEFVTPERFPRAERRLAGPVGRTLAELPITADTYCLIVTRGHNHDQEALFHLAERGARYVGMIGSKRKIRLIFENLLDEGIAPEALAGVHAPVGIDIGSQTVPEIAISILAELVAHRNLQGRVPGRPESVSAAPLG